LATRSREWELTTVDRKERATVVARNNMSVDSCEGVEGGGPL
jgi:hypothetical protein